MSVLLQFKEEVRYGKAPQMAMVQKLVAAGVNPEQVARMFSVPFDLLAGENPKDGQPEEK